MPKSIVSDVISIEKPNNIDTQIIEMQLEESYGSLIRWAILDATDTHLKLCITYEKEV